MALGANDQHVMCHILTDESSYIPHYSEIVFDFIGV